MELNLPGGEAAFEKLLMQHPWVGVAELALIAASVALNLHLMGMFFFRRGWFVSRLPPVPWSFARGMSVMANYAFIFFGVMVLVLMLRQEFGEPLLKAGFADLHLTVLGLTIGQVLSLGLAVHFSRAVRREGGVSAWALWKGSSAREALLGIPLFLLVVVPVSLVVLLAAAVYRKLGWPFEVQPMISQLCQTDAVWFVAAISFFAVVVAPLVEEIFFRGILYATLRSRWGIAAAAAASSLVFAILHFHLAALLPLFALAVVLCLAYERTGSLPACIVAHSLFNSMSILLIWLFRDLR